MTHFTPSFGVSATYRASVQLTPGQPSLWCRLVCLVGIVFIIGVIAVTYVRLNQKEAALRKSKSSIETDLARSHKELENLRVIVESHKGPCILRRAQALGLQPPVAGQIVRLRQNTPKATNNTTEVAMAHDFQQRHNNTP